MVADAEISKVTKVRSARAPAGGANVFLRREVEVTQPAVVCFRSSKRRDGKRGAGRDGMGRPHAGHRLPIMGDGHFVVRVTRPPRRLRDHRREQEPRHHREQASGVTKGALARGERHWRGHRRERRSPRWHRCRVPVRSCRAVPRRPLWWRRKRRSLHARHGISPNGASRAFPDPRRRGARRAPGTRPSPAVLVLFYERTPLEGERSCRLELAPNSFVARENRDPSVRAARSRVILIGPVALPFNTTFRASRARRGRAPSALSAREQANGMSVRPRAKGALVVPMRGRRNP